ncbi:MAG: hypothetical protein JKY28_05145 [Sulfurimonas sp.]|nr:hypothetical protein [Sulfurimonas sp.]PHQ89683.1 MAG: hypothetical protein COB42_06430 [Sulfurimonas sp.]
MKAFSIFFISLLHISLMANELQWVDEQIQAIKPSRNGISTAKINAIKSPFIFLNKTSEKSDKAVKKEKTTLKASAKPTNVVKKQSKSLVLDAIINKSALINGKWYKLNEKIGKYTLSLVNTKEVILSYKKKKLLLSTAKKNKSLKFKSN